MALSDFATNAAALILTELRIVDGALSGLFVLTGHVLTKTENKHDSDNDNDNDDGDSININSHRSAAASAAAAGSSSTSTTSNYFDRAT